MTDHIAIKVNKTPLSRLDTVDFNHLPFGTIFSDHLFKADYHQGQWKNFEIAPYQTISVSPALASLHYGQTIFEGIKAYKQINGQIAVFRPDKNFQRFNQSAERMCMPTIPIEICLQGLTKLIAIDRQWVPSQKGQSLYIRPIMFASDEALGVKPSKNYQFFILTSPADPYYLKNLKMKIELTYSRADQGGVGFVKTAGNYARSMYPTMLAQKEGFDQIIWTDPKEHLYIEEAGTANLLFVINNVLIVPTSNTILKGITSDTIVSLAQSWGMPIEKRRVRISEILQAIENHTLQDAFAAGTAATLTSITTVGHKNKLYHIPDQAPRAFSKKVLQTLEDIRHGLAPDSFNWNYLI